MSENCLRHEDVTRRLGLIETERLGQVDENAKLWKAINLIREEKATTDTLLSNLITSVAELKKQMNDGFTELRLEILELKNKPAKRWEMVVASIISATVAMIIGVIATVVITGRVAP